MKVECYYTGHEPDLDKKITKILKSRGFKETGSGMLLTKSRRDICFEKQNARDKVTTIQRELPKGVRIRVI